MSTVAYASCTQHINRENYQIRLPAYALAKPARQYEDAVEVHYEQGIKVTTTVTDHLNFMPTSFYDTPSPSSLITSGVTISKMLELFESKVDYQILSAADTIEIFFTVDDYLKEIRAEVFEKDRVYTEYAKRMLDFRAEMYFHFRWAIQKTPHWRAQMNKEHASYSSKGLRGLLGLEPRKDLDGIVQLMKPPYTKTQIDDLFKTPVQEAEANSNANLSLHDFLDHGKGVVRSRNPFDTSGRDADDIEHLNDVSRYL